MCNLGRGSSDYCRRFASSHYLIIPKINKQSDKVLWQVKSKEAIHINLRRNRLDHKILTALTFFYLPCIDLNTMFSSMLPVCFVICADHETNMG